MKQHLLIIALSFLSTTVFCQSTNQIVEGKNYKGVIFYEGNKLKPQDTVSRWTPSKEEIEILENQLLAFMAKQSKKKLSNQIGNCPIIHRNLDKYIRQYAGYFSTTGEKMIYVNCFWYDAGDPFLKGWKWENRLIEVLDGCSFYWQIYYHVKTRTFSGFSVNGIG